MFLDKIIISHFKFDIIMNLLNIHPSQFIFFERGEGGGKLCPKDKGEPTSTSPTTLWNAHHIWIYASLLPYHSLIFYRPRMSYKTGNHYDADRSFDWVLAKGDYYMIN